MDPWGDNGKEFEEFKELVGRGSGIAGRGSQGEMVYRWYIGYTV
jgi:hypothetical protein